MSKTYKIPVTHHGKLRGSSFSIMAHTGFQEAQYLIIKMTLAIERSGSMVQVHGYQLLFQNSGICVTQEPPYHHSPAAGHPTETQTGSYEMFS